MKRREVGDGTIAPPDRKANICSIEICDAVLVARLVPSVVDDEPLWHQVAGGGEEPVPLLAGERDVAAGGRLEHACGLGGADHDLHVRWVPCDPRHGDA